MTNEVQPEMMAVELSDMGAVELSEDELDTVAGGLALNLGDGQSFSSDAFSEYGKKTLIVGQSTSAGPDGANTTSFTGLEEIFSRSGQSINVG